MVQCHITEYKNSRLRLEYGYLLFNKLIMNRTNLELVKKSRILTSFAVTESCCNDTPRDSKKIREAVLEKYANEFCHNFYYRLWVYDTKSSLKGQ